MSRFDAAGVIALWRRDYNEQRLHAAFGEWTPAEFAKTGRNGRNNESTTKSDKLKTLTMNDDPKSRSAEEVQSITERHNALRNLHTRIAQTTPLAAADRAATLQAMAPDAARWLAVGPASSARAHCPTSAMPRSQSS